MPAGEFITNYLVLTGKETMFAGKEGIKLSGITDGTSNTIMTVEADPQQAVIWTKPEDLDFEPSNPFAGLGNLRPGGFLVGIADGSVRFIRNETDPDDLRAAATIAGGEPLSGPDF